MTHKTEAERLHELSSIQPTTDNSIAVSLAAHTQATLALVEALEAANEQARIANLITLATSPGVSVEVGRQAIDTLTHENTQGEYPLNPAIAATLGIKTGENDE